MKIAVCGGGWLGQPLCHVLKNNGHALTVTRRLKEDAEALSNDGITGLAFTLGNDLEASSLTGLFENEVVVLNIPPGRKNLEPERFTDNMCALIDKFRSAGTRHLLFVSTTAVYGESDRTVYEYSPTEPETPSAHAHVAIEKHLQETFGDQGAILRLSGLVGGSRHPARSLSGRSLNKGNKVVNLIHRDDVIRAIDALISNKHYGHIFHLSTAKHPSRQAYYSAMCQKMGIALPSFDPNHPGSAGKQVNADFTLTTLNLSLNYSDPMEFPLDQT